MMKLLSKFDPILILCIFILFGFGTAVVASVSPELLTSQIIFYVLGLIFFFIFASIDFRIYRSLSGWIYWVSILLLVATLILGLSSHGAVRWISLGAFRLQFSEVLKPFLVLSLASFLASEERWTIWRSTKIGLLIVLPIFLVFKQPDLASALVYSFSFMVMVFLAGVPIWHVVGGMVSFLISIPILSRFLATYQKERLLSFFSPHYDPLGSSYNAIQAKITVGSGQFFGKGLGQGTQTHLLFLPERQTDFAFSSMAEELGFVGAIGLLVIYFVLLWRIFGMTFKIVDRMGMLTLVGVGAILVFQVFVNVGMNLGIVPVAGITLPLVSYGGSSVVSTMIALGLVQNVISLSRSEIFGTI